MEFHMRSSRVLKKMREGKVATCTKINLSDLRNCEIAAMCGFDCIWVDMEHIPNDYAFIENSAKDQGVSVFNSGYYDDISNNWWGKNGASIDNQLKEYHRIGSNKNKFDSK